MKLSKQILEEIITPDNCLGIPRSEMPQIPFDKMDDFLDYVHDQGRDYERISLPAGKLKPSQSELDTDKADKIWSDKGVHESPIIISGDHYVLDGHHRWLAMQRHDKDGELKCIMLSDNADPALKLMHGYEDSHKRDIEDNLVESIMNLLNEESEDFSGATIEERITGFLIDSGYEEIHCVGVDSNVEEAVTVVTLADDDDNELQAVFFVDEELGPCVTVVDDIEELDAEEIEVIELHNAEMTPDGMVDLSDLSFLGEAEIDGILNFGELETKEDSEEIEERSVTVIRGGKRVRKKIVRKKRKKRLSAKRKLSIRRAVRKKRAKKAQIQRKRKRSLKLRKRAKLKNKPKNLRVIG